MNNFLRSPFIKVICCYLALVMVGLFPGPMQARASFISHQTEETTELDAESLETLRMVLEHDLIAEKLSELGLTEEEVIQRVEQLSPDEREIVLEKLDAIQSGGDDLSLFWFAVVYLLIVIGLLMGFFGAI